MQSSYAQNNIGLYIEGYVKANKPINIVEFGTLEGYSTYHILKAIQNPRMVRAGANLKTYDLWDEYQYKHADYNYVKSVIDHIDIHNQVEVLKGNFYEWIKNPDPVDLLHLDISNDGEVIEAAVEALPSGTKILFEGGSAERDNIEWMIKYNKKPINSIKYRYQLVTDLFPSLSILKVP